MYQTVGHQAIDALSEAWNLPVYKWPTKGKSGRQTLDYDKTDGDEVEDLFLLLKMITVTQFFTSLRCSFATQYNPYSDILWTHFAFKKSESQVFKCVVRS